MSENNEESWHIEEFDPSSVVYDEGDAVLDLVDEENARRSPIGNTRETGVFGSAAVQAAFSVINHESDVDDDIADDIEGLRQRYYGAKRLKARSQARKEAESAKKATGKAPKKTVIDGGYKMVYEADKEAVDASIGSKRKVRDAQRKAAQKAGQRRAAQKAASKQYVKRQIARASAKAAAKNKTLVRKAKLRNGRLNRLLARYGFPASILLLFIVGFLTAFLAIGALAGSSNNSTEGMNENESIVAGYFLGKKLDALHIAAVMANIEAESGFDPDGVEAGNGIGHGLCQWSFGRWSQLQSYASSIGKPWNDLNSQLDFLWGEMTGQGPASAFSNVQYNHAGFMAVTDLKEATRYFGANFERPNEAYAHWDRRYASANKYYAILMGAGSGGGSKVAQSALAKLGSPYVWGASGPDEFDCSGLVVWAYKQNGIDGLGRTTYEQIKQCTMISRGEEQPGDLVFMNFSGRGPEHVGICIGNGQMVHAPTFGSWVKIDNVGWSYGDYKIGRYNG